MYVSTLLEKEFLLGQKPKVFFPCIPSLVQEDDQ